MTNAVDYCSPVTIPGEQRKALLERILASQQFSKSPRLSSFLQYICEQDDLGFTSNINEQNIGVAVFGRQQGYSVGDDSIVRSQARFLRLRLADYFSKEGSEERIVLSVPKGSYLPVFQIRSELMDAEQSSANVFTEERTASSPQAMMAGLHVRSFLGRRAIAVALLISVLFVLYVVRTHWKRTVITASDEQIFWRDIFAVKRVALIVPSDSSLVLLQELSGKSVSLSDYMNRKYLSVPQPEQLTEIWNKIAHSQYTNMVDLNILPRLLQKNTSAEVHPQIRFARDLSLNELKESNAILIGGRRSNPWVDLYTPMMHLNVDYDWPTKRNFVHDSQPSAGGPENYYEVGNESFHAAYGVIAYLPSLDHQGSTLLIGGTSKAGTEAAAEFLFSENFADLLHNLHAGANIAHFEVLVVTQNVQGESHNSKIVCFHRL